MNGPPGSQLLRKRLSEDKGLTCLQNDRKGGARLAPHERRFHSFRAATEKVFSHIITKHDCVSDYTVYGNMHASDLELILANFLDEGKRQFRVIRC